MFRFNRQLFALTLVILILCPASDTRAQMKTPRQERVETITASGIPSLSVLLNNQGVLYTLDNDGLQTSYGCVVSGFQIGNNYILLFLVGEPPSTLLEFTSTGWILRKGVGTEHVYSEPVHINWINKSDRVVKKK